MFDPPEQVPYAQIPYAVVDSAEHRALALQAARESIVLLKNEGDLLPLSKNAGSIAVIGPNADDLQALLGNYNGTPSRAITPLEGIRALGRAGHGGLFRTGLPDRRGRAALEPIPAACLRPADPGRGAQRPERGLL